MEIRFRDKMTNFSELTKNRNNGHKSLKSGFHRNFNKSNFAS